MPILRKISSWFAAKKGYCCNDCVKNLYQVLDGEASQEQAEHFMTHINDCSHCFECYNVEKSVKEVVKLKIEHKPVPNALVDSIKQKIKHCE